MTKILRTDIVLSFVFTRWMILHDLRATCTRESVKSFQIYKTLRYNYGKLIFQIVPMRIQEIKQYRSNRAERGAEPIKNFCNIGIECSTASNQLLENNYQSEFSHLIERSIVISFISAVEVYYKDIVDTIFKLCNPEFIKEPLKHIHQNKYDINDLIDLHVNMIHPCELVTNGLSFQNTESIERVFSKFLKKGFWSSLNGMKFRFKDTPKKIATYEDKYLQSLKYLFNLRHELIHDAAKRKFIDSDLIKHIDNASLCVIFSNIILLKMINENLDPELKRKD